MPLLWLFDEPPSRGSVFDEVPASPQPPCEVAHRPCAGSSRGQAAACKSRIWASGRADCGSAGSLHSRTRSRRCFPKSLRELCTHHGCAQCDAHPTRTQPGSFSARSVQLFLPLKTQKIPYRMSLISELCCFEGTAKLC